jgi:hypothetical protein
MEVIMKRLWYTCLLILWIGLAFAGAIDDNRPASIGPWSSLQETAIAPRADLFLSNGIQNERDDQTVSDLERTIRVLEERLYVSSESLVPSERESLTDELNERYAQRPQNRREDRRLDQGGDNCTTIVTIGGVPYSDVGTTFARANNWNTAASCAIGGISNAPDVIYSFTPAATGTFLISTCGSAFNTLLEVRTGGGCPGTTQVACADDGCGTSAELVQSLTGGQTYYIIIDGNGTSSGAYDFRLEGMCNIYYHAGDHVECAEAVDSSHARLDCDGGACNETWGGEASYTDIAPGETWFGKLFTYTNPFGNASRDTDWYRFTLHEPCSVHVTISSECPLIFSVRPVLGCTAGSSPIYVNTCEGRSYWQIGAPAGDYEILIMPWSTTGLSAPRDYRLSMTANPLGGCWVDDWLTAPGSMTGNTCTSMDRCDYTEGLDRTIRVTIPETDEWTFSLCGSSAWSAIMYLMNTCCDEIRIAAATRGCSDGRPMIPCVHLTPGDYYLLIESTIPGNCGAYQLSVTPCRTRCCYGTDYQSCVDVSTTDCAALGGIHDDFWTCADRPCPVIQPCMDGAEFSQRPRGTDDNDYSSGYSDIATPYLLYESFSGLVSPISSLRFWGSMRGYRSHEVCVENPKPCNIRFYADNAGSPGALVHSYHTSLFGDSIGTHWYYGTVYEFTMVFASTIAMDQGWISIRGEGDTTCNFMWAASFAGDGYEHLEEGGEMYHQPHDATLCLNGCMPPDSVTLLAVGGDEFYLDFWAPVTGSYKLYYTLSPTGVYPTDYTFGAAYNFTWGHRRISIEAPPVYARFVVTLDCGGATAAADPASSPVRLRIP